MCVCVSECVCVCVCVCEEIGKCIDVLIVDRVDVKAQLCGGTPLKACLFLQLCNSKINPASWQKEREMWACM